MNRTAKNIITVFILISSLALVSFQKTSDLIYWSGKNLSWSDFKGKPNPESNGVASTYSYIDMHIKSITSDSAIVKIKGVFSTSKSWVRYGDKVILSHENGHFNISELYSRLLKKKIAETNFTQTECRNKLNRLFVQYDEEMDNYHNTYDDETESSMNNEQQKKWEKKIEKQLQELENYKGETLVIRFSKQGK